MVGIVIVSHSEKIAQGVIDLCKQMAADVPMAAAGGLPGGEIGTDFRRIYEAVEAVRSDDGVVILFDMGSALMTTEMVMEQFEDVKIKLADAPVVEGAIAAAIASAVGHPLERVLEEARQAVETPKLL